jgi:hypothetical protein
LGGLKIALVKGNKLKCILGGVHLQ